ncbi:MAG: nucleotidyltransferase family protein [Dehalococcoidia bacterium]
MPGADGPVAGVILAAGGSARMGEPKQLLPLDGRPILQHVIDAAQSSCLGEIVVVLGAEAEAVGAALRLPERARTVVNPGFAEGQSTSLRAGLRSLDDEVEAAAVLLGDQPGVSAELIDRVVAAYRAGGRPVARPVYTTSGSRTVPGHPVVLSRAVWPEVEKLTGDQGARALLARHDDWLLEAPIEGEPPPDIDTREDYRRAAAGYRHAD